MFRVLTLVFMAFAFSACSTKHKSKNYKYRNYKKSSNGDVTYRKAQRSKHLGKRGYFTRPAIFETSMDEANFNSCEEFRIIGLKFKAKKVILKIKQDNRVVNVIGLNRKTFKRSTASHEVLLNHYFNRRLAVLNKTRDIASTKRQLCSGKNWKQMTKAEFLFVNGDPEEIKRGVGSYAQVDQWIYKAYKNTPPKSYYFSDKKLYSWK